MKIKLIRNYRKQDKNGKLITVFVYAVTGTDEQIKAYREAQGENLRESDSGELLWFSTRFVGETGTLLTTSKGGYAADMSKFDQAASLAEQYGGNFGQALATAAAANLISSSKSASVAAPAKKAVDQE